MKFFSLRYVCFSIAFFIVIHDPLLSQVPDFSKAPLLDEGDSVNIVYLIHHGVKIAEGKAICWFPKDSLSENQKKEITDMMNSGIRGAEKFIGAPLPWQGISQTNHTLFIFALTGLCPMA